ncbi:LuxR family transcriptional regulator [Actinotalea ferrariae CF5-4]|uniref:LuxR family transcriptional regulator n=1 Tax=Actinotalea ferrariae CF5-4 TaxID=948458 RepID=A0A021VLZ1_9CELL|nr:response regulator transcription factor [Actinotalea ferrariae]EYR62103.1 LuxR family transcriptional regulator [Actinotalea ferrariae CF5-4]
MTPTTDPTPDIRVVVVEDQPLFRSMLAGLLAAQPGIRVVGVAGSAADGRRLLAPGRVDVAVLDVELGDGNGIALGVEARGRDGALRILTLSSHDVLDLLLSLPAHLQHGWSFLSKTTSTSAPALVSALRATARGETVLDPELVRAAEPRAGSLVGALTPRQYEVLCGIAQGLSNLAIAEDLGLTEKSVQNHVNALYAALGVEQDRSTNPRVTATLRFVEETRRPGLPPIVRV